MPGEGRVIDEIDRLRAEARRADHYMRCCDYGSRLWALNKRERDEKNAQANALEKARASEAANV